jgi:sulfite reductase alpha subunit-like flavoprotein
MSPVARGFLLVAILAAAPALPAQGGVRARPGAQRRPIDQMLRPDGQPLPRRAVEQQIRQRLWQVTKRRLALSDDQMTKLEQVTQRFDQRRRQLGQQEKTHRQALRSEILADSAANQATIASSLEQLQQIQRQRLDLQVEEQKEFAMFMTPLQRARFMALQEEFRKRMQELLRARADSASTLQSP